VLPEGSLHSLVTTSKEPFENKSSGSGLENRHYGAEYATPLYPQKLTLTSSTIGGSSVDTVLSRTKTTELLLTFIIEDIPVTGRGGLLGCEMLRISHCLDSPLTAGGKDVGPTHRPRLTPQKYYFSSPGSHFC
jgi:hypothetical protein